MRTFKQFFYISFALSPGGMRPINCVRDAATCGALPPVPHCLRPFTIRLELQTRCSSSARSSTSAISSASRLQADPKQVSTTNLSIDCIKPRR